MKLSEFIEKAGRHIDPGRPHYDFDLVVKYKPPFTTVGGTPCVEVVSYQAGFDWDQGKFILVTDKPLTLADGDYEQKFKKLQDDYGWAKYENRNLKADNKKLQKRIDELVAKYENPIS